MYFPITCDVEMVTDITESPMSDMILSASLRRKEFSFRRGTAMIISVMVRISLHTALYSYQTTYSSSDSDDYFDNETPNGTG